MQIACNLPSLLYTHKQNNPIPLNPIIIMKKYLFVLLTFVMTSLAFVSCSDDDDDNPYNNAIVGTWQIMIVKTIPHGSSIAWPFEATYARFKANGNYYGYGYFGNVKGTWSIKDKTVYTYVEGELYASYEIVSITQDAVELKMTMDGESIWIGCKKEHPNLLPW